MIKSRLQICEVLDEQRFAFLVVSSLGDHLLSHHVLNSMQAAGLMSHAESWHYCVSINDLIDLRWHFTGLVTKAHSISTDSAPWARRRYV